MSLFICKIKVGVIMIYYFSATGNSRASAEYLKEYLGESISAMDIRKDKIVTCNDDYVGFIFPVYCYDAPKDIIEFIKKCKISISSYCFCIVTCGGDAGNTLYTLSEVFNKMSVKLSYAKAITLPDNTARLLGNPYNLDSLKTHTSIISDIAEEIKRKKEYIENINYSVDSYRKCKETWNFIYKEFRPQCIKENCISCGLCIQNCPVQNIKVKNGKPMFQNECMYCLACIHHCPQAAISFGSYSLEVATQYDYKKFQKL